MRYLSILLLIGVTLKVNGQQINPVPDYIFRNSMSVGRNAPTDTSAYFSIGPRFGATRGFMPPMVTDTASVTGTKRNGLLIYSIQRNSFLYWDSTGSRWSRIAANLDTLLLSTRAWRQKGDDSLAAIINTRTDTVNLLSTKAWRQKGIDSVAALSRVGGSGTINRHPKFTAAGTIGNGSIADSSSSVQVTILSNGNVGINETQPKTRLDVRGQVNALGGTDNAGYMINWESATRFARLNAGTNAIDLSHNYKVFANTQDNASNPSWSLQLNSGDDYFMLQRMPAGSSTMSPIIRSNNGGETLFGTTTDAGDFRVQVAGRIYSTTGAVLAASSGEVYIGTDQDAGNFMLQVNGATRIAGDFTTTGLISTGKLRLFETGLDNIAGSSEMFLNSITTVFRNSPANSYTPRYGQINQTGLSIGTSVSNHAITIDKGNATASYIQFTAGTKTGSDVNDGFHLGIDTSGNAEIRQRENLDMLFYTNNTDRGRLSAAGELWLGYTADQGTYILQANGNGYFSGSLTTGAPTGGTAQPWKLGTVATVSPTSPNRTIEVEINGTTYYIHAKTTND